MTYGARVESRLNAAGIKVFRGCARLVGPHKVAVSDYDSGEEKVDTLVSESLSKHLRERRGVEIRTNCTVKRVDSNGQRARVELDGAATVEADAVVVALGSVPNVEWLGLETVQLRLDEQGAILVDGDMRSSVPHIFACGDCCSKGGLLSLAKRHGLVAATAIHRTKHRALADAPAEAPVVIWTVPKIAIVGDRGGRVGSWDVVTSFADCDRGILESASEDFFLKIVYETQTLPSRIYVRGVHIFGPHAEKLIARGVDLVGRTLDEALQMPMPAAATLEELYTSNLQTASKRTVSLQASPGGTCSTM